MKKSLWTLLLLLCPLLAEAATTVTLQGTAKDLRTATMPSGKAVFRLMNCTFPPVRTSDNSVVSLSVTQNLDASGVLSGTIVGNDNITCGPTSYYQVTLLKSNGQLGARRNYSITGTTFDIGTAPELTVLPSSVYFGIPLSGKVSAVAQSASITTANLVASATAGQYDISYYLDSSAICATPGPAQVVLTVSWTDEVGAKSTTVTLALGATSTAPQKGSVMLWNNAVANITYATAYTACTSGTGTYGLRMSARQVQ